MNCKASNTKRLKESKENFGRALSVGHGKILLLSLSLLLAMGATLCRSTTAASNGRELSFAENAELPAFSQEFSYLGVIYVSRPGGAEIIDLFPDSPAQRSGLQIGDTIVAVDGISVVGSYGLRRKIERIEPGKRVELSVRRYNLLLLKLKAKLKRRPANYLTMGI